MHGTATGAIPVINLANADTDRRDHVIAQVRSIAKLAGFYHVATRASPPVSSTRCSLHAVWQFNEEPIEAKVPYSTRDPPQKVKFNFNFNLFLSSAANWHDTTLGFEPKTFLSPYNNLTTEL
uniref:Non-haem dioxygenase N-terminal domain-containing protein n=1 Tax=Leersia perrieri TaxID=77586 RepID=A0A0D9X7J6_9ORYZ